MQCNPKSKRNCKTPHPYPLSIVHCPSTSHHLSLQVTDSGVCVAALEAVGRVEEGGVAGAQGLGLPDHEHEGEERGVREGGRGVRAGGGQVKTRAGGAGFELSYEQAG